MRKYWVSFIRGALKYDFPFEKEVNRQYLSPRLLWGYISSRISTFTPLELLDSAKESREADSNCFEKLHFSTIGFFFAEG